MKWKELSLKERKQVYDSVRVNNPDATYFDIKEQFDVPTYQDGKGRNIKKEDLPPEYRVGTPEYFERQKRISGAATTVQPEAYFTPAGYVKDAVNFVEDLGKGNYKSAALDAALNIIPWGVGKSLKKIKSKVGRLIEGTEDYTTNSEFAPTITKRKGKKKTEEDYDSEFSEVIRKHRNMQKYNKEVTNTIEDAIFPNPSTLKLMEDIDRNYGTNYMKAYADIAENDMLHRGGYLKWNSTDKDGYGKVDMQNIKDGVLSSDVNDYTLTLDNNIYQPGTANHELGHIADGLAGSRVYTDYDSGLDYITNNYLNFLADPSNAYSATELHRMGLNSAAGSRGYLLNPTEAKSHMLGLKRGLKQSGRIKELSDPVTEDMVVDFLRTPDASRMTKNQFDLYRNKQSYLDRLNRLSPMSVIPVGVTGAFGIQNNE